MAIWKKSFDLEAVASFQQGTLAERIGLRIVEVGDDYVRGTLPVDERTRQPYGRLHGGASVVLAEELGSFAASLCLDLQQEIAFGLEINANHLRGVTDGIVTGTARALHIGRSTHVWEIHIEDDKQRLVCVSRLTVAIVQRGKE